MARIGINGLGRIGRRLLHQICELDDIYITTINDINTDIKNWEYLINYDSIYKEKKLFSINVDESDLFINSRKVKTFHEKQIHKCDWRECDLVIDSSGIFENLNYVKELKAQGIKHLLVTNTPPNFIDSYLIFGVNHKSLDPSKHFTISTSICDATALGPVFLHLHDHCEILSGNVITLHPWLNYQNLMDGPSISWSKPGEIYTEYTLGRSAHQNIIPKPTSAVDAVRVVLGDIMPWNNINSFSYRTNTSIVCSAQIKFNLKRAIDKNLLHNIFENLSRNQKDKICKISNEPLVSGDFQGEKFNFIYDERWSFISDDGKLLSLVIWYDNEEGYSSKVLDIVKYIKEKSIDA